MGTMDVVASAQMKLRVLNDALSAASAVTTLRPLLVRERDEAAAELDILRAAPPGAVGKVFVGPYVRTVESLEAGLQPLVSAASLMVQAVGTATTSGTIVAHALVQAEASPNAVIHEWGCNGLQALSNLQQPQEDAAMISTGLGKLDQNLVALFEQALPLASVSSVSPDGVKNAALEMRNLMEKVYGYLLNASGHLQGSGNTKGERLWNGIARHRLGEEPEAWQQLLVVWNAAHTDLTNYAKGNAVAHDFRDVVTLWRDLHRDIVLVLGLISAT